MTTVAQQHRTWLALQTWLDSLEARDWGSPRARGCNLDPTGQFYLPPDPDPDRRYPMGPIEPAPAEFAGDVRLQ
jgi:hypothetical protein